jgi:hypothetical protein
MSDQEVFKGVPLISPAAPASTDQDKLDKSTFPTEWFEFDQATNRLYLKDGYSFTMSGGTWTVTGPAHVTTTLTVDGASTLTGNVLALGTLTSTGLMTATAGATSPVGFTCPRALYAHTATSGTNGGTATSGAWRDLIFNTESENTIGASFNAGTGVITLPAGTYDIELWHVFGRTHNSVIKIVNVTLSQDVKVGGSVYDDTTYGGGAKSSASVRVTFATATDIKIQYFVTTTKTTYGLGIAGSCGPETFGEVKIVRIG